MQRICIKLLTVTSRDLQNRKIFLILVQPWSLLHNTQLLKCHIWRNAS